MPAPTPTDRIEPLQAWWQHLPAPPVAAFLRAPGFDDDLRASADLDLLVFDPALSEERVERVALAGGVTLDLLSLPAALLGKPPRLAAMGLITHRLLSATPVLDGTGLGARTWAEVATLAATPQACAARCDSFLELGALTVREVGVTRDWPALARFWLHMAHAAALAALSDAQGQWCPSIYTRPLGVAKRAQGWLDRPLQVDMVAALGLAAEPGAATTALQALHARVRARCPEPLWPAAMPAATRAEYRYWRQAGELQERLAAASALVQAGAPAAALFYLRYAAYSTLRLAMLHRRAVQGWPRPIPFLRPETEVRPDLQGHQPDLLPLAEAVFGPATAADLEPALAHTLALHEAVLAVLAAKGLPLAPARPWKPHDPRAG